MSLVAWRPEKLPVAGSNGRTVFIKFSKVGHREMKSLKQGYNIVFLWNKKEQVEGVEFHKIHKEIREIFEEANLIEKV